MATVLLERDGELGVLRAALESRRRRDEARSSSSRAIPGIGKTTLLVTRRSSSRGERGLDRPDARAAASSSAS